MTVHVLDTSDSDEGEELDFASDLDQIAADVQQFKPQTISIVHPVLPAYTLVFRGDLRFEEIEAWRRKATIKVGRNGVPDQVDAALASAMIVVGSCLGIYRDGKQLMDGQKPVLFSNKQFQAKLLSDVPEQLRTSAATAAKFLIRDSAVGSVGNKIVEENGFGEDAEEAPDPTGFDS